MSTDASLLISEWSNSKILASYWCNVQALTNEGRVYRIRVQLSGIILSSSFLHLKFQTSGYILILEHIPVFFQLYEHGSLPVSDIFIHERFYPGSLQNDIAIIR